MEAVLRHILTLWFLIVNFDNTHTWVIENQRKPHTQGFPDLFDKCKQQFSYSLIFTYFFFCFETKTRYNTATMFKNIFWILDNKV